jgi:hypothetical protein
MPGGSNTISAEARSPYEQARSLLSIPTPNPFPLRIAQHPIQVLQWERHRDKEHDSQRTPKLVRLE